MQKMFHLVVWLVKYLMAKQGMGLVMVHIIKLKKSLFSETKKY